MIVITRGFPIMLQDKDFKLIKDKKIRNLYQTIYSHLKHIDQLQTVDELKAHETLFKAYKNGYTSNHKMFKALLKEHLSNPYIYMDWFQVFITSKIDYLNRPKLKHLDELLKYCELQSTFGYLFLITDTLAKHHVGFINLISRIDILSYILIHDLDLDKTHLPYYPQNLIQDFGIEYAMDGRLMKNEKYIALWEYIHFKIRGFIKELDTALIQFQAHEVTLITFYIEHIGLKLKQKRTYLMDYIKTL